MDGDQRTRRLVTRLNYSIREKEIALQRDQLAAENANADLVHRRELDRMQKDIELKNAEENCVAKRVEMLRLQIQLEQLQRGQGSSDVLSPP